MLLSSLHLLTADTPPCKTLNQALGNQSCLCSATELLSDIVFELVSGTYHLEGCVGIVGASDITIQSRSSNEEVVIECETFPNNRVGDYGNLYVCGSSGVTFRGILFTRCGPQTPNVFLNSSSGILFDNCTFL